MLELQDIPDLNEVRYTREQTTGLHCHPDFIVASISLH